MRIGSLFSGIGGLELGLERAGLGHTVWQVERDARCRAVLAKHWPTAQRFEDVCHVGVEQLANVDLICGGFPCQDVSSAGKRAGLTGTRSGLWFEYLRIVSELRPAWVVVENVASGARAWVDTVVGGLEQLGYACLPVPLAAADVGAPHKRERVFIVATSDVIGEAVWPESRRVGGACRTGETVAPLDCAVDASHPDTSRREGCVTELPAPQEPTNQRSSHWGTPQPSMVRVVHGVSGRLDGARARIASLGNAVVPQCAEVIGHVIRELAS